MKIEIRNLGAIKHIVLEPKPLTIITGKNNSGKTYAMYTLWALASLADRIGFKCVETHAITLRQVGIIEFNLENFLNENWNDLISKINSSIPELVAKTFNVESRFFKDSKISITYPFEDFKNNFFNTFSLDCIDLDRNGIFEVIYSQKTKIIMVKNNFISREFPIFLFKDYLSTIIAKTILSPLAKKSFLMPTERAGLNLFFNDLNTQKKNINKYLHSHGGLDEKDLDSILNRTYYSRPIEAYIDFLFDQEFDHKVKSTFLSSSLPYLNEFIPVTFRKEKGHIYFQDNKGNEISLHLASSAIKANLALWVYLNNMAAYNDLLMIDEPEINLHPDAQRHMARFIAFLVNKGIKVAISTHSDYFIRELNSLIMLNNDFSNKKETMSKYGYLSRDKLSCDQLVAYCFENGNATMLPMESMYGVQVDTFDNVFNSMNEAYSLIQFQLDSE
ncbi:ATP-binding protein [Acinetobacter schindleri]|uniref:ATP-binding protein n=1 Tax=Acinetobacter schindleri TaxID=108981 RepID=UPI002810DEDB|nr:ATP-binding protein [Acinetobacter schindleri]